MTLWLTGVVDLPGVKVIQKRHHQALAQVDLHQGHCHILPALNCGHLLQHGQSTTILHLVRGGLRSWHAAAMAKEFFVEFSRLKASTGLIKQVDSR